MRFFNTEGPVVGERHYRIDPLTRVDLDGILDLIGDQRYFVLHAPRQTGKTSVLIALQNLLNEGGAYRCLYVNVESAQTAREDVARGMEAILGKIGSRAKSVLEDDFVASSKGRMLDEHGPHGALSETLVRWSAASPKPLVLLIDEIDSLLGDTLISVLRQLRSEYGRRAPDSVYR